MNFFMGVRVRVQGLGFKALLLVTYFRDIQNPEPQPEAWECANITALSLAACVEDAISCLTQEPNGKYHLQQGEGAFLTCAQ